MQLLFLEIIIILWCAAVLHATSPFHHRLLKTPYSRVDFNTIDYLYYIINDILKWSRHFFLLHHGEEYNDYWWSLVPQPWFVQRHQQQFFPSLFLHHQCRFNTVNKANVLLLLLLLLLLLNCFELIGPEWVLRSPRSTIKNHYHT